MECCAVVVAAGSGKRMGADKAKQYLLLDTVPILAYTLIRLARIPAIGGIVVVVGSDDCSVCRKDIVEQFGIDKIIDVVSGGKRRQDSVYNGLLALEPYEPSYVLVHDGVRPFFSEKLPGAIIDAAKVYGAVVPGMPIVSTVKECNENREVVRTVPRETLWEIQTPQGFSYNKLMHAYRSVDTTIDVTDDAMIMELSGHMVKLAEGNKENLKITRPVDLTIAHQIMQHKEFVL